MTTPLTAGNARVKEARKLSRRSVRAERRLFLVDGPKAVGAALAAGAGVREVFATPTATDRYDDLAAAARRSGAAWTLVDDRALASLSDAVTPPGVVGVCDLVDVPLESVLSDAGPSGASTVVICADVRDPGNAGTIIRTADAAGAAAVVLAGHSVDPHNAKTVRATVGSLFHLPVALTADVAGAVAAAQAAGLLVLAADGAGETDLFDADPLLGGRVAWLFGNEAWGLPAELAELADHRVRIPIRGAAESLNLATAAAVCLFAGARAQRP
ncbi:TrmH family RNA methyltransferase [Nocardioides sambongensis]|uniref:TrmH family RNA methyltransferase n=1 Tax=Nocardioides sambongensis TaxID=2589074 RepID=UPI00112A5D88|nr:RNA methyltransferase [Nocardioides sambongensis]